MNEKSVVIIDLREFIIRVNESYRYTEFARRFPLNDIISVLLSVFKEDDYTDIMNDEIDRRFSDVADRYDLTAFIIYIDSLAFMLNAYIDNHPFKDINISEHIFHRWVDSSSVVLVHHTSNILNS